MKFPFQTWFWINRRILYIEMPFSYIKLFNWESIGYVAYPPEALFWSLKEDKYIHCRWITSFVYLRNLATSDIPISGFPGWSKAVLTAPLECSRCPYHRSLLSFRIRARSSMPSRTSSSLELVVTMSCGLTLQICLIIALSFCCRRWRFGFVNGQVSLAWSIALRTQELYTGPCVLKGNN